MLKRSRFSFVKACCPVLLLSASLAATAQDNSPYSRYGLGDAMPNSNITTRSMGGISAAYSDGISINFNNPASYSGFFASKEARSKKLESGRVVLDVGININNRTLIAPNTANRFTSSDLLFSYIQVGVPLRKNWGLSFGIRPVSRISYLVNRGERLKDPSTGLNIDSAVTQFRGSGGSYLPTIGTGFSIGSLSLGVNAGYIFGNREATTLRSLINNDTTLYYASSHSTNSSFGDLFFNAGLQYDIKLSERTNLRLGVSGNWEQKISGSQDRLVQTYTLGSAGQELQIDSVFQQDDVSGSISYPASYKGGFLVQNVKSNGSGWMFGADYTTSQWENYRFFGQADSVQNNWQINVGGQFTPRPRANFFSRVDYRLGFFAGKDYIRVQRDLPQLGFSFGMGLPFAFNRLNPGYFTKLNLTLEYGKRGNNDNLLKENLFRISVGFNFSDLWFRKPKYD